LHAALVVLAIQLSRQPAEAPEQAEPARSDPKRQVEMIYLPPPPPTPRVVPPPPPAPQPKPQPEPTPQKPPPPPPPTPPPQASTPPPEKEQRTPEPDANAPPEAKRSEGAEQDKEDQGGAATPDAGKTAPATADNAMATMESEARRIFGRPRLGTPPGVGPRATRPMEAYLPDHPEKCVPKPAAPRDSAAPVEYGVVEGKIFRQDDGRPLGGAHLQLLGTPYVTFTDDAGEYRFRFDLSLVDNCRTQYVRVTAPGYESRLLVLMVGPNVRSDDVLLKKR
jgi:hypothetical protein